MIDTVLFNLTKESEWDTFVEKEGRNATFLHTRKFFNHNAANANDDSSLMFYKSGKLIGVLPATLRTLNGEGLTFHSHPRSTYGGFVISMETGVQEAVAMVDGVIQFARSKEVKKIMVRNPFRFLYSTPSDETDYAMWLKGFKLKSRELEVTLSLNAVKNEEDLLALYDGKTRNQVRKALKSNLQIGESENYSDFWELLANNLAQAHEAKPTHSLEDFMRLRALVAPDLIKLFGVSHENRLVAGMVVFLAPKAAIHAQYIASDREMSQLCAVNGLVHYVANWALQKGYGHLNLGLSTEEQGKQLNAGLFKFKEGFGARGVLRETMEMILE
jgi:hypothetical protein